MKQEYIFDNRGKVIGRQVGDMVFDAQGKLVARNSANGQTYDAKGKWVGPGDQRLRELGKKSN